MDVSLYFVIIFVLSQIKLIKHGDTISIHHVHSVFLFLPLVFIYLLVYVHYVLNNYFSNVYIILWSTM